MGIESEGKLRLQLRKLQSVFGNSEIRQEAQAHIAAVLAGDTLRGNIGKLTLNGIEQRRSVPSKRYYIHQWSGWDSPKVAEGLVHLDPRLAHDELRATISGQWENGLIPHITYNPA